jgi:hypothetical protein
MQFQKRQTAEMGNVRIKKEVTKPNTHTAFDEFVVKRIQ